MGGGSSAHGASLPCHVELFFLEFLPGESLQLCYCSNDVNKSFFSCLSPCWQCLCELYPIAVRNRALHEAVVISDLGFFVEA